MQCNVMVRYDMVWYGMVCMYEWCNQLLFRFMVTFFDTYGTPNRGCTKGLIVISYHQLSSIIINYHCFRIGWQPFPHSFWGFLCIPTTSHKGLTGLSHDPPWVAKWYTSINSQQSSMQLFVHLTHSKACYQEFWRLLAGFLLETPDFSAAAHRI